MQYRFYIRMDGTTYGPYSTEEIMNLNVPDDTEVMEESVQGWYLAKDYPFTDLLAAEKGYHIDDDGTLRKINIPGAHTQTTSSTTTQQQPSITSSTSTSSDESPKFGWNWGAFFFNWLWGVFNGVYWPLVLILLSALSSVLPWVSFITLGACIYLGINGSEQAWNGKSWDSAREFNRVQKGWSKAVLWTFVISIGLGVIIGIAGS